MITNTGRKSESLVETPHNTNRGDIQQIKRGMVLIRQMHENFSQVFKKKKQKSLEYIEDFLAELSLLVEKLGVFPYHITWECISQEVPGNLAVEDGYILRQVAGKLNCGVPQEEKAGIDSPFDFSFGEYFRVPLSKKEFAEKFLDYFKTVSPGKVFEIPLKPGFSYIHLPVFPEGETMPQWILTLVYNEENTNAINDPGFLEFLEYISQQIEMAWDKFQENIAAQLLEHIDYRLGGADKTRDHSTLDQLKIIAGILAREIQADWCGFFLANEQANTLNLEIANIDLEVPIFYSLTDHGPIMVKCFTGNHTLRLMGRKNLEAIVKPETLKPLEKSVRSLEKKKKLKAGQQHFTPYVLFEQALVLTIAFGAMKPGLMTLFRAKHTLRPEPQERYRYETRPFSQFETRLLRKVQRYIFNIFAAHDAVQKRMRDLRKVSSPLSDLITAVEELIPGESDAQKIDYEKLPGKLRNIKSFSRIISHYVMNFEILLDLDTLKRKPQREKIWDLRAYLIHFASLYTPLVRPKCIHINVTEKTPGNISIEVDKELFKIVITNIIDNAVKYSFDPEDRLKHGLQAKPVDKEDRENVLITAWEEGNSVNITISSYGIELSEEEKHKIFDREFRGVYGSDRAKGTGIGLYLAKKIIEMHGGTIELISGETVHNTVFKIVLPQREPVPQAPKYTGSNSSPKDNPGKWEK